MNSYTCPNNGRNKNISSSPGTLARGDDGDDDISGILRFLSARRPSPGFSSSSRKKATHVSMSASFRGKFVVDGSRDLVSFMEIYERARRKKCLCIAETIAADAPSMLVVDYDAREKGDEPRALFDRAFVDATADAVSAFLRKNTTPDPSFAPPRAVEGSVPPDDDEDAGECVVLTKPPYAAAGTIKHGFHLQFPKAFLKCGDKEKVFDAFPQLDRVARTPWLLYGSSKAQCAGPPPASSSYVAERVRVLSSSSASTNTNANAKGERRVDVPVGTYFSKMYLVTDRVKKLDFSEHECAETYLCLLLSTRDLGHLFSREHYARKVTHTPPSVNALLSSHSDEWIARLSSFPTKDDNIENENISHSFDEILDAYDNGEAGGEFRNGFTEHGGVGDEDDDDVEDAENTSHSDLSLPGATARFVTPGTIRELAVRFPWARFPDSAAQACRDWRAARVIYAQRSRPWTCVLEPPGGHTHSRRPVYFLTTADGRVLVGCRCGRKSGGRTTVATPVSVQLPPPSPGTSGPSVLSGPSGVSGLSLSSPESKPPPKSQTQNESACSLPERAAREATLARILAALLPRTGEDDNEPDVNASAKARWLNEKKTRLVLKTCAATRSECVSATFDSALEIGCDVWEFRGAVFAKCASGCACPKTGKSVFRLFVNEQEKGDADPTRKKRQKKNTAGVIYAYDF